jgi:hypothetical protein
VEKVGVRCLVVFAAIALIVSTPAAAQCTDADGDRFYAEADCGTLPDCNDLEPLSHPGAIESCDGFDNDCNGLTDDHPLCYTRCDASSPQVLFTEGVPPSAGPEVVWGRGELAVAWNTTEGGAGHRIAFQRFSPLGMPLSPRRFLGSAHDVQIRVSATWNGQNYGVTWSGANDEIFFAAIDRNGDVVVPTRTIGSGVYPDIAWGGGVWGIVWIRSSSPQQNERSQIYYQAFSTAGAPLGPPTNLTENESTALGWPVIEWSGTKFGLAWWNWIHFPRIREEVMFATVSPQGEIGVPRTPVTQFYNEVWSIVWNGSEFGMVWDDFEGNVNFERIGLDGQIVGTPVQPLHGLPPNRYGVLAWSGSEWSLSWNSYDGNVYWARLNRDGRMTGSPVTLAVHPANRPLLNWQLVWTGTQYLTTWDYETSERFFVGSIRCGCIGQDADGDGVCGARDCDDGHPAVFPGAPEACDGIDDNCDGILDACDGPGTFDEELQSLSEPRR